jgi:hypothetical protein
MDSPPYTAFPANRENNRFFAPVCCATVLNPPQIQKLALKFPKWEAGNAFDENRELVFAEQGI